MKNTRAGWLSGYNQNLSEIYPFVFKTPDGESIGIVALGVIDDEKRVVHIYHLGTFISKHGDGCKILKELCHRADKFNILLSVSAIFMPNGKDPKMDDDRLTEWYKRFGFKGDAGLLRVPVPV